MCEQFSASTAIEKVEQEQKINELPLLITVSYIFIYLTYTFNIG